MTGQVTRIADLRRLAGTSYFVIGFIARIPFAMNIVGVLTLVTVVRDSIAEGGLASAAFGIASGIGGPALGALADRIGQRFVLIGSVIVHAGLLVAVVWAVYADVSLAVLLLLTLLAGATIPPIAAFSRARWIAMVNANPRAGEKGVATALGYESMADEITFVGGPVLVGLLATLISPAAPMLISAAILLVFAMAFAVHPSVRSVRPSGGRHEATQAPVRALLAASVIAPVIGMLFMGSFFGASLASLTDVMDAEGFGESTGLIYGVMGATSAFAAIFVGRLPASFPLRLRWLLGAIVITAAGLVLWAIPGVPAIIAVFVVVGFAVGATLVTIYTLGADAAPHGRLSTTMAALASATTIGQGITVATIGALAEGTDASMFWSVALAGAGMALAAAITFVVHRSRAAAATG